MKIGDKVKIKTGRRGRPAYGEIKRMEEQPDDAAPNQFIYTVLTKNGLENFLFKELEVIENTNAV